MKAFHTTRTRSWILAFALLMLSSSALENEIEDTKIREKLNSLEEEGPSIISQISIPSVVSLDSLLNQYVVGMGIHTDA